MDEVTKYLLSDLDLAQTEGVIDRIVLLWRSSPRSISYKGRTNTHTGSNTSANEVSTVENRQLELTVKSFQHKNRLETRSIFFNSFTFVYFFFNYAPQKNLLHVYSQFSIFGSAPIAVNYVEMFTD